ncbi:MAG TPA: aminotransferase class V-fold PLP-dependent enzyme, partial [Nitrososphaerales archaeon]|nr:aminotransferase class V-fold PLP-dependent enzyme [Nitrososphaerales archaeon]
MEKESLMSARESPINIPQDEFRRAGHVLVDEIAELLESLDRGDRPVAPPNQSPKNMRSLLAPFEELPRSGVSVEKLVEESAKLVLEHSLYNGHPRFFGYITSSPSPVGILSDFLASAVNPNVGAWVLSPAATEMELQAIRWIAEMIGYPRSAGGILVDGGNMANFVCFLAARRAKIPWDVRKLGTGNGGGRKSRIYTSVETHTWIQKAADQFGLGTDSIRWIPTDDQQRMDPRELENQIIEDKENGNLPLMVVGTAGSTATGAIDPLGKLSHLCKKYDLWFHVDGAYGGFAVLAPGAPEDLQFMREADSIAVDPHKWLYAPLEAGCSLVKNPKYLLDAFSYHPSYYHFDSDPG